MNPVAYILSIPNRIRAGYIAAQIYKAGHDLRLRQKFIQELLCDDPAEMGSYEMSLSDWDSIVTDLFKTNPGILQREAVWLDLAAARDLLIAIQDLFYQGDRLWAFRNE